MVISFASHVLRVTGKKCLYGVERLGKKRNNRIVSIFSYDVITRVRRILEIRKIITLILFSL